MPDARYPSCSSLAALLQGRLPSADDRLVTYRRAPVRVTHLIHDLRRGGAEHLLVDLAGVVGAQDIEMSVVSMRPLDSFPFADQLRGAGVRVESLSLRAWWDPRGPGRLRRLIPDLRPDLLHSHLKHADGVAGRVARSASIPHISTLHLVEDGIGWLARRKRNVAIRSRIRTSRRTIAVSEAVREWYLGASGADASTVVTIPNGVPEPGSFDTSALAAIRAELGVSDQAIMAAMVAVMRPGKGHEVLLDSLPFLENAGVVFVLAGDGPARRRLQERSAGTERVVFAGFREDFSGILAAADLVVHPSLSDALPTALIHALAAGRPIVASSVGGIPEIVPADAGELVVPGDPRQLAAAIDTVAADPDARLWMGKRARERYDNQFTATLWAARLRSLYDEVLAEAR